MADSTLSTKQRIGFAAAPLALIGALVAALGTNDSAHEGRRYTPYYDSAGILTVCAGITGPAVVKGKRYSDEECTRLETAYVRTMLGHMRQCVRGEFEFPDQGVGPLRLQHRHTGFLRQHGGEAAQRRRAPACVRRNVEVAVRHHRRREA